MFCEILLILSIGVDTVFYASEAYFYLQTP